MEDFEAWGAVIAVDPVVALLVGALLLVGVCVFLFRPRVVMRRPGLFGRDWPRR